MPIHSFVILLKRNILYFFCSQDKKKRKKFPILMITIITKEWTSHHLCILINIL